jgi:hypothetical protein
MSFMQQQLVVTHTIRQTEIPALLDSWVTNAPSVKMFCPQQIACPYFHKVYIIYKGVGPFIISQVFMSPIKLYIGGL